MAGIDRSTKTDAHPPRQAPAAARPLDPEKDRELENGLLNLLVQAERLLETLTEERKPSRITGALETSRALIKHVFLFADGRIAPETQARAFEKSQNVYGISQAIEDRLSRLTRKELDAFFADERLDSGSPRADYRRFGLALRGALDGYFTLFSECFTDPEKERQWKTTFGVFLDDLARRW